MLIAVFPCSLWTAPLYSPTWGFRIDLPEGYEFTGGDSINRFSFTGPLELHFDIAVHKGTYKSMKNLIEDVQLRLKSKGDVSFFEYREKLAALLEIQFDNQTGWGLCLELEKGGAGQDPPLLLALAYGKTGIKDADLYHLSALDSITPSRAELHYPGPITEFSYPRGEYRKVKIADTGLEAWICENDAEAAQALIEREFALLKRYVFLNNRKEAWIRYYRAIYRDSWDRLADAAFQLERSWQGQAANRNNERVFAGKALAFVQGFKYERDFSGSDFVNLVCAVTEGRGDCDSRAMLWAIILIQANIRAAMMVSSEHSHAMGLADIEGQGARFEASGKKWLVAETTTAVDIGLIAKEQSETESWIGVVFE